MFPLIGGILLAASVSVSKMDMLTYPFSDPDPVPATSECRYPYFRYDGSTTQAVVRAWKCITLESDRTRVVVLPEVGGKIWAAIDKVAGRDFLYCNHVMKFRDIAMRGPWLSGGIEFNFGIIGHAPSSSTPVDWFVRTNSDDSVSCFVGSNEYITRAFWQVEIRLVDGVDGFETRTVWHNASGLNQPYYHWMNAAFSVRGDPVFHYPGDSVVGHEGEVQTRRWPKSDDGRHDLSVYSDNAFGGAKSYHVINGDNGFFGVWWRAEGFGASHVNDRSEKYGRKIFFWALSREGGIWEDLLTDSDGQYAELQSGRGFVQPRRNNYRTPFKHPVFSPGTTETFTDKWAPVRDESVFRHKEQQRTPVPHEIYAPVDFDWESVYGLYVRGEQYVRERHDREGREYLERAVEKDPFFVPAIDSLANDAMRRGDYARVHELARRVQRIDIYDAAANYLDGFAFFAEGDCVSARERLGLAAFSTAFRSAAWTLVARTCLHDGDFAAADSAALKALAANSSNPEALLVRAIAARGTKDAVVRAKEALSVVPLFHSLRYELELAGGERDFSRVVANEIPDETFLEMGLWYHESGLHEDAVSIWNHARGSVVAKLLLGDLDVAMQMRIDGEFPFRRETLDVLRRAAASGKSWKFNYLYALQLAAFGYDGEADRELDLCGDRPDAAVFYLYRASRRKDPALRLADLDNARRLGDSWRVGIARVNHFADEGRLEEALGESKDYLSRYPESNQLVLAHARILCRAHRYRECLDFLDGVTVLPSEFRNSATEFWHEAQNALGMPLTWPEGLGKGKPFD